MELDGCKKNYFYLNHLVYLIFLTGPMAFLSLRPYVNVFFVDIVIVLALISLLLNVSRGSVSVNLTLVVSIFLIFFGFTLSSIFSVEPSNYFGAMFQYGIVFSVLLIVNSAVRCGDFAHRLLRAYLLGFLLSVFVSYLLYFGVVSSGLIKTEVAGRFSGVWWNPNTMAKQINAFLCLLMGYVFLRKKNKILNHSVFFILTIASLFLIAASASFGGILFLAMSMLVSVGLILWLERGEAGVKVLCLLFFLIGIGFTIVYSGVYTFFVPEVFVNRVLAAGSIEDAGSASDKVAQIRFGAEKFFQSPFVGVGLENGQYHNLPGMDAHGGNPISFHSFYISLLVEGGAIAAIGFCLLFIFFAINSFKSGRYRVLFLIILSVFLINLIVNNNIYTRFLWFPVLLLAASIRKDCENCTRNYWVG